MVEYTKYYKDTHDKIIEDLLIKKSVISRWCNVQF